jgi:predicted enzyme related to lactoylglutathione lyase
MADPIVYLELPSTDLSASQQFFAKAFGWDVKIHDDSYAEWEPGGQALGCGFNLVELGADCPEAKPLAYIQVEDIEAKLVQITAAGGAVIKPKTKISDEYGFYALFADPSGSVLGLWSKS